MCVFVCFYTTDPGSYVFLFRASRALDQKLQMQQLQSEEVNEEAILAAALKDVEMVRMPGVRRLPGH